MTKKRFFASVLALFLLLSCVAFPAPAYAEGEEAPSNGLELSKTVKANDDGTYTITMESYTTGTVTSSTKTVPVDIVLVLDQSGSMADGFGSTTRQAAMKTGVNNFIAAVAGKHSAEADHRMSIVTFGSNASLLQGWTFVNQAGKDTLQGKISSLPDSPRGATNVAAGMRQAETLMGSGYNYTGTNTPRQKVVIVFTDGVPTTSSDFDTTVATNAIASAKNLKDSGATVYSVGIFNGANPNELYGASGFDRNCNGTVGSDWSDFSFWMIGDIKSYDVPAGNRFLNYLSSNFPSATEIGIRKYSKDFIGIGYHGWQITKNFERTSSNYYLTATNSDSLNTIFQTIVDNIQTANIDLGKDTVVKDTVTKYFNLPENTSDIKVYTADAKAGGSSFEARVPADDLHPSKDGNVVTVTGFDFNANFVSKDPKKDGTYGKKLIIEFDVTPKDGFIGGNDVPTNDWQNTGVYDKDGALVENFNDATTTPKVNVPIKKPDFTTNDKTIYLGNSTEVSGLYTLADTKGWEYDYVDVVKGVEGVTGTTVSPTDCTDYSIKVTFKPQSDGAKAEGTANSMEGVSKTDKATVHVLKPNAAVTLNDVSRFYGESYTLGADNNAKVSLEWKDMTNGHTTIPAAEGTAPYEEADLIVAYEAPSGITVTDNQFTVPKDDVTITVKLMNGNKQVTDATITTTCNLGCEPTSRTDGTYIVHVKTATLTITKSGMKSGENALFVVTGEGLGDGLKVSVPNGGSVTVSGLCVGADYTVTEDTGWSSCYTAAGLGTVTMDEDGETMSVTNALKTDKTWLRGEATANNVFNKVES